jgi:hypothetical protein
MSGADNLVDALAVYRLTRLVVEDTVSEPLREWIWKNHPPDSTRLGYLVTCPWCVSIYMGTAVAVARTFAPRTWSIAARALAFSAVTGITTQRL